MVTAGILLQGIATLIATLIGVFIAFYLDRLQERKRQKRRVLQHLKAIRKELRLTNQTGEGNRQVIKELQRRNNLKADHYIAELFSTDAWDAAIHDQVIEEVPDEHYHDLQEFYRDVRSLNELIHRLRLEPLHPSMGEIVGEGGWEYENWTYTVYYHDPKDESLEFSGLGPLILMRSRDLAGRSAELSEQLEEEISSLESELSGRTQ